VQRLRGLAQKGSFAYPGEAGQEIAPAARGADRRMGGGVVMGHLMRGNRQTADGSPALPWGLTGLLLLFVMALALALAGPARAQSRCGSADFRVMTYNIRLDTPADGANRWALRRDLLIGQVRLLQPAILGLQEVLPGQRSDLVAALPGFAVVGGGRDDGKLEGEAAPLMIDTNRYRIAASGMFWLSPTPAVPSLGWDAGFRRVASWARLVDRTHGTRLLVINTHWDHVGLAARLNSARLLRDWIARHRRGGEEVILLGDFNAPLAEASMQALLGPDLRDTRAAAIEPPTGPLVTFNGWVLVPEAGGAIDHVLASPGLTVRRHHVLAEHFGGRLASDHFPVIADLFRPQRSSCRDKTA